MPESHAYKYAVIRVVPRVDRDEFINAGIILFHPEQHFLKAKTSLTDSRLKALSTTVDTNSIRRHLHAIERICRGDPDAGPIAQMSPAERFQWLTSPRSTMIQMSPVRGGTGTIPENDLAELTQELVA